MPLPEWLTEVAGPPPSAVGKQRKAWLSAAVGRLVILPSQVRIERSSAILKVDPRTALPGFVAMIVGATLLIQTLSLAFVCVIAVSMSLSVGAGARMVLKATVTIGLLTAIMMIPAMTDIVAPGVPLVDLGPVSITVPGVKALSVVTLKTMACVAFGFGLFSSNRAEDLFSALRSLRVPGMFVAVLILTYRYLQVVLRAALEVHTAGKSRAVQEKGLSGARGWIGERIGGLFSRSYALGDEVYASMTARGFDGEWIPTPASALTRQDLVFVVVCFIITIATVVVERKWLV